MTNVEVDRSMSKKDGVYLKFIDCRNYTHLSKKETKQLIVNLCQYLSKKEMYLLVDWLSPRSPDITIASKPEFLNLALKENRSFLSKESKKLKVSKWFFRFF